MDRNQRRFMLSVLPRSVEPPPDAVEYMDLTRTQLLALLASPPDPMLDVRQRLFSGDNNMYEGRDVFSSLADNRFQFFNYTGETPETLTQLMAEMNLNEQRSFRLSKINRTLLLVLWLRQYPTFSVLASMFGVSTASVRHELSFLLLCVENATCHLVKWPSIDEWRARKGQWGQLEAAVGAIDGTSHEIQRPMNEPQQQYYSGYRQYHCIHTQVVVDTDGTIRYVESGFMGHLNDAQQFNLMTQIGGPQLLFPGDCVLLGDKIYPNRHPLVTPFTSTQLRRQNGRERRKRAKFNSLVHRCRVTVEHSIAEMKCYKAVGSVWRQQRITLPRVVKICCALVIRRKQLNLIF